MPRFYGARIQRVALAAALGVLCRPLEAEPRTYRVDPNASVVTIHVGRGGLFGFAGHEHEVLATAFGGEVAADAGELSRSSVSLDFDAAGLQVTGKGDPPEDVPKVQARMAGPDVLDVARFAVIAFRSSRVEGRDAGGGVYNLRVTGELRLRGAARTLTLPLRVELAGDVLTASGQAVIRQSDFGISPISVAGVVKVRNELGIDYKIVARATP